VVLVQRDGDLRIQFYGGQHEVKQKPIVRVLAGAATYLDDDGGLGLAGRLHDGLNLLHVIDVESANAIATLGRFIQELSQRNHWHNGISPY
jgi:hypothetical protein